MTAAVGALGLVVGFLAGVALDDALDLWLADRREHHPPRKGPRMRVRRPTRRTITWWLLIVLVAVNAATGLMLIQQRATAQRAEAGAEAAAAESARTSGALVGLTRCIASYQREFGEVFRIRATAAEQTNEALDRLIFAVADERQREFRRALANYVDVRRDQEAERRESPLPTPPTQVCGVPEQ